MNVLEKMVDKYISQIIEAIPTAIAVIDVELNLIAINKSALDLLCSTEIKNSLQDYFDLRDNIKLNNIIKNAESEGASLNELVLLRLSSGKSIRVGIIVKTTLTEQGEKFVYIHFVNKEVSDLEHTGLRLAIPAPYIENVIQDTKLISLLKEIKSTFPFTFLGKGKVQQEIDKLNELVWITDAKGKYVIVNEAFAKINGFTPRQFEGKTELNFLPLFIHDFLEAVDLYVKETLNYFIIDGFFLNGVKSYSTYQTVKVPLVDADNMVIAIISIAAKKKDTADFRNTIVSTSNTNSIEHYNTFPINYLIIDNKGDISDISDIFAEKIGKSRSEIISVALDTLFAVPTMLTLRELIIKGDESLSKVIKITGGAITEENFKVRVKRFYRHESETPNYFIVFESVFVNFETLINSNNPMNEILIQKSPIPIFIYDTENLTFKEVNDSALKLYGYTRNEFLQMDLADLYTPEDLQTLADNSRFVEGEFSGPYKHRKKNGELIFVEISRSPLKMGERDTYFNFILDVSSKIEDRRQGDYLRVAYEMTDNLVFVIDSTGFIEYINPAVEEQLNVSSKEIINNSILELVSDEHRSLLLKDVLNNKLVSDVTLEINLKKGFNEPVKTVIQAKKLNPDDAHSNYILVCSIIKESSVVVKEVVKEVIREVPKEVIVEKEVIVNSGSNVTKVTNGIDPSQISYIFHELLTPINVILGFVQELKESVEIPTEEQIEAIEIISQNREKLKETMDSIGEYAVVEKESNELDVTKITLAEIVDKLELEIDSVNQSWKKELLFGKVSSSLAIDVDIDKIRTFLYLLVKAASYISDEETVILSLYQFDDNNYIAAIKDSNTKISDKLLDHLTDLFSEPDIPALRALNISRFTIYSIRKIFELLGGRVEVTHKSGKPFEIGFVFNISPDYSKIVSTLGLADIIKTPERKVSKVRPLVPVPIKVEEPVVTPQANQPVSFRKTFTTATPVAKTEIPVHSAHNEAKQEEEISASMATLFNNPAEHAKKQKKEVSLSELSCLYMEDQIDSQVLFKVQMKELKKIKCVQSFEEALPILQTEKFDVVIIDINLEGEYNGLDALKALRQIPMNEKTPAIAVTAYVLPGDKENYKSTGFSDFISKPLLRNNMIEAFERILP